MSQRKARGLYWREGKEKGSWYLQFYCKGKEHRFSLSTTSLTVARRERDRCYADKAAYIAERLRERDRADRSLEAWAGEYLTLMEDAGRRDMRRRSECIKELCKRFPRRLLDEILSEDIEAMKQAIRDRSGPANVNRHLNYASHLFTQAIRRGLLRENPCKGIERFQEPPGRVVWLEEAQEAALLEAADAWFRPILVLAADSGMRRGELANLLRTDIDRRNWFALVRYPKNREARQIPLTSRCVEVIRSLPPRLHHPYLFSGHDGEALVSDWQKHLDRKGVPAPALQYREHLPRAAMQRATKKAGLGGITFHCLRHHAASWMAMRGVSDRAMRTILGHKTPKMTDRYAHLRPDYLRAEMEKMEPNSIETNTSTSTAKRVSS